MSLCVPALAVVSVDLPKGQSTQEFFSPNYPLSFPDDDLMTWDFGVPRFHETKVKILRHMEPRCRKKEPGVEYEFEHKQELIKVVKRLSDNKPTELEVPFKLSLRNCEMDQVRTRAEALGLSLHFSVSSIRSGSECTLPLSSSGLPFLKCCCHCSGLKHSVLCAGS